MLLFEFAQHWQKNRVLKTSKSRQKTDDPIKARIPPRHQLPRFQQIHYQLPRFQQIQYYKTLQNRKFYLKSRSCQRKCKKSMPFSAFCCKCEISKSNSLQFEDEFRIFSQVFFQMLLFEFAQPWQKNKTLKISKSQQKIHYFLQSLKFPF